VCGIAVTVLIVIIDADGSRVSIAFIHLSDSVCDYVCLHDKTAETKIAKLVTEIVHHDTLPTNEY